MSRSTTPASKLLPASYVSLAYWLRHPKAAALLHQPHSSLQRDLVPCRHVDWLLGGRVCPHSCTKHGSPIPNAAHKTIACGVLRCACNPITW